MNLPHISINQDPNGSTTVEVEDTELYDFVEDYLVEECHLVPCGVTSSDRGVLRVHTMVFSKGVTTQALQAALQKLDPEEIERIFKLNNS